MMLFDIRQKILVMETDGPTLRSSAHAWDMECGQAAETSAQVQASKMMLSQAMTINTVEVGMMQRPNEFHVFKTPLHALAAGWRLLNKPTSYKQHVNCGCENPGDPKTVYEWWFEKISSAVNIPQWGLDEEG